MKKKVLIVDDELCVRQLVKRALGTECIVLEATDGGEAVNIARTEKPDLILMDILMPQMDGYTACHKIKKDKTTREIPVIMLTGIGHELNKKLSFEMGAEAYMTKPFDVQALLDRVN